jgi:hypothetical protein
MNELGFARQKDSAEKVVEKSHALAARILEVLGVERGEVRSGAEMLGVIEHGLQ